MKIDYMKLALAMDLYESLGFKRIESPWWVPAEIMKITAPPDVNPENDYFLKRNSKCLVASGEQSFLYMANKGMLANGRFQTTTPCFRNEVQGLLHRKYFLKTELIVTDDVSNKQLMKCIEQCESVFAKLVPCPELVKVVSKDDGTYDIEYDGIEVGSYGIRQMPYLKWIFATGIAEPRLSCAIAFSENKKVEG